MRRAISVVGIVLCLLNAVWWIATYTENQTELTTSSAEAQQTLDAAVSAVSEYANLLPEQDRSRFLSSLDALRTLDLSIVQRDTLLPGLIASLLGIVGFALLWALLPTLQTNHTDTVQSTPVTPGIGTAHADDLLGETYTALKGENMEHQSLSPSYLRALLQDVTASYLQTLKIDPVEQPGTAVKFTPQRHEKVEPDIREGDTVYVRRPGWQERSSGRLIRRAQVSKHAQPLLNSLQTE